MNPTQETDKREPSDSAGAVVLPEMSFPVKGGLKGEFISEDSLRDFVASCDRRDSDDRWVAAVCEGALENHAQLIASLTREKAQQQRIADLDALASHIGQIRKIIARAESAEAERDALRAELANLNLMANHIGQLTQLVECAEKAEAERPLPAPPTEVKP